MTNDVSDVKSDSNTSDVDDDALFQLYNNELMALSARVSEPRLLDQADAKAHVVSIICGSEVTIELSLQDGRIKEIGYEIEACSLTKAVVAIMATAAIGKNRQEIAAAAAALREMLEKKAPVPAGDWTALKILEPVIDYKARHETILLPFAAVEKAFANMG